MKLPADLTASLRQLDQDGVVEWLATVHARLSERREVDGAYEEARVLFRAREERLGRERRLVDEALARLGRGPAPPPVPQQELVLVAAEGRAGGRFRLRNALPRASVLAFAPGLLEDGAPAPPMTFEPAPVTLGPGEEALVRVELDLRRTSARAGWTVPVDVVDGDRVRQRLWVTLR